MIRDDSYYISNRSRVYAHPCHTQVSVGVDYTDTDAGAYIRYVPCEEGGGGVII
jgi:hypothetical protein